MRVFWRQGYEGASLPALTKAMGINRPSMYAAFGNKESLFKKAVERYVEKSGEMFRAAMARPTAREAIETLLRMIVCAACGGGGAGGAAGVRGCMLVQGALAGGRGSERVRRELAQRRCDMEARLRERIERGQAEGDVRRDVDAGALAKYFATFQNGLAVQAAGGARAADLEKAAAVAMRAWPE